MTSALAALVSMKSGLEDRNNARDAGWGDHFERPVSMKSGLEDRNNSSRL